MRRTLAALAAAALALPLRAGAHHGVAALGVGGPEGPGAALETTSALPLPERTLFLMLRSEYVPFERYASAEPRNKTWSLFETAVVGFGLTPWLSAYLLQPLAVKAQDGTGRNAGLGDTGVLLSLGLKYDDGLRLVPERESLDDLMDWHFSAWISPTFPLGPTDRLDRAGAPFSPDMQTGFGSPSLSVGVAALKQLGAGLTWLADASYHQFFPNDYGFTRYQFGGETRVDTALVVRAVAREGLRLDVAGELDGLHLQRDRERNAAGVLEAANGTGGAVLYAGLGVRLYAGRISAALGVRRAVLRSLHEEALQQGSEGQEVLRATLTLSTATRL